MSEFSRLPESRTGSAFEKWALVCAVIAVISVLGAHGIDKIAENGDLPVISFNHGGAQPNVDYSATASIPRRAQSTNLDPCNRN